MFVVTGTLCFAVLKPLRGMPAGAPRTWVIGRWGLRLAGTVPLLIGAISVMIGDGGGLYWVAAGVVFAILAAIANAWVLLVEILR